MKLVATKRPENGTQAVRFPLIGTLPATCKFVALWNLLCPVAQTNFNPIHWARTNKPSTKISLIGWIGCGQACHSTKRHNRQARDRLVNTNCSELLAADRSGLCTLDRQVALKLPRLEVLLDKNKRDRFNLEAELAASLEHPGIIRVYEADLIGPEPFIAMAYGDGPNLAEWMTANSQKHSWQSLTALVAEIALSVDHAHQQGILHRDLKPANILMIHRTAPVALQLQEELSPLGPQQRLIFIAWV